MSSDSFGNRIVLDSLGNRMKSYENAYRISLTNRLPIIIRIDGRAFHSYTKGLSRPVDENFIFVMNEMTRYLCSHIQGVQMAYLQSDEVSFLINNYKTLSTEPWFENNLQKIVSVSAAMASATFSSLSPRMWGGNIKPAMFDSRAFILPKEEVANYFLWRMQDCTRNSIQSLAKSLYSQNELSLKKTPQLKEMCSKKGIDWNDLPISQQRGRCVIKTVSMNRMVHPKTNEEIEVERSEWVVDNSIPIFSDDRNYIEKYLGVAEDKDE